MKYKFKKGASSLLALIILSIVIATTAIVVMKTTSVSFGKANNVSQEAIALKESTEINVKPVNGATSKPQDGEHAHDWRLVKKEVLSATERKDTYLCFSCGERKEEIIEGSFSLNVDVKNGVYIINNNTYTSITEYIKTNYEAGVNYTVKFNYNVLTKPSSLPYTSLGMRVVLQNIKEGTEKKSTDIGYFSGQTGSFSYSFLVSDTSIVKKYPVLAFELVSKSTTTASIQITDFQVVVEEAQHQHEMSDWSVIQKATCTSTGLRMRNCTVDGCAYNESETIDMLPHSFYEIILSEPTCKSEGEIRTSCLVCGYSTGVQKVFGPHRPVYTIVKESKNCETPGTYAYICLDCGSIISTGQYSASHTYTIEKIPSTCTTKGKEIKTCTVCGHKEETELDYEHKLDTRRTTASCVDASYTEIYCTECGKVLERHFYADKVPHNYNFVEKKIEDYGYPARPTTMYYYTCTNCHRTYKTDADRGSSFSSYVEDIGTNYTIIHMQQNIEDDNYTIVEKEVKQGIPNTNAAYSPKEYEGFIAPTEASVLTKINENGLTTIEYKYDRKKFYIDLNGSVDGTAYSSSTGAWTLAGAKFDLYINNKVTALQVADYYKQYKYGTKYEFKNVTCNTGYSYVEGTGNLKGTVGLKNISCVPQFESLYTATLKTITGNTTINYSKNSLPMTLPIPSAEGYSFIEWQDDKGTPTEVIPVGSIGNKTYTAKWHKNYVTNNSLATTEKIYPNISSGTTASMKILQDEENYGVNILHIEKGESTTTGNGYYFKVTEKLSTNYLGEKATVSFWARGTGTWSIGYEQGGYIKYSLTNEWKYYTYEFNINDSKYCQFLCYSMDKVASNIDIRGISLIVNNSTVS